MTWIKTGEIRVIMKALQQLCYRCLPALPQGRVKVLMEELLEGPPGQPEEDDVHLEQAQTTLGVKAMSGSFKVLLEVKARS